MAASECGGADQEMLQSGAGMSHSRRAFQRPFLQRKGVECYSRGRAHHVYRPGGERGQGISITRIIRGFCISEFEERIVDCCSPLFTQISLCFCSSFYVKFSSPCWPLGCLPHSPQAWPSLANLLKITVCPLPCFPPTVYFSLPPLCQLGTIFLLIYYLSLLIEMLMP